jgi:hypothetical protein
MSFLINQLVCIKKLISVETLNWGKFDANNIDRQQTFAIYATIYLWLKF